MQNEVHVKDTEGIVTVMPKIEQEDLPTLIKMQVKKLDELDNSVKHAMDAAEQAKESVLKANEKSAGFGKKKVAIEELQSAGVDLAKAMQISAEAQKISFEFQTKLAEVTKYLFGLGMSNIANNRMVVRELEQRLMGASEEEISELAQQELMVVIRQLKEQEDLLQKIDDITLNIYILKENLVNQFDYSRELNEKLFENQFTLEKNEDELTQQKKINQTVEETLKAQAEINQLNDKERVMQEALNLKYKEQLQSLLTESIKHSELFTLQSKLNNQYDQQFNHFQQKLLEIQNINEVFDMELTNFGKLHEVHQKTFNTLHKVNESVDTRLSDYAQLFEGNHNQIQKLKDENVFLRSVLETKSSSTFSKVTLGVATVGTILSVVHFII